MRDGVHIDVAPLTLPLRFLPRLDVLIGQGVGRSWRKLGFKKRGYTVGIMIGWEVDGSWWEFMRVWD